MPRLRKKYMRLVGATVAAVALVGATIFVATRHYVVLSPKGTIAQEQKDLLVFATLLSLVVVLPVLAMTFIIVWKYRDTSTKKRKYTPDWDGNHKLEALWWGIPTLIILVLSVVTWQSSHALDPYKPLVSDKQPITVQVVALQWKWLFIYPDQGIATVNYLQIPVDTPINFKITADAPMNSFWIPQLGGQVYAMTGMSTSLHLMATESGDYQGSSANLSGEGFAGMHFIAHATSQNAFDGWVTTQKQSQKRLGTNNYPDLAQPSQNVTPASYQLSDAQLYDTVVTKYMNGMDMHHAH